MAKYVDIASVCTIIGNLLGIPYEFDRPITMDDVNESIDEIKSLPSTDVVEQTKIDNAFEEMQRYSDGFHYMGKRDLENVVENCIKILKWNIGESK